MEYETVEWSEEKAIGEGYAGAGWYLLPIPDDFTCDCHGPFSTREDAEELRIILKEQAIADMAVARRAAGRVD